MRLTSQTSTEAAVTGRWFHPLRIRDLRALPFSRAKARSGGPPHAAIACRCVSLPDRGGFQPSTGSIMRPRDSENLYSPSQRSVRRVKSSFYGCLCFRSRCCCGRQICGRQINEGGWTPPSGSYRLLLAHWFAAFFALRPFHAHHVNSILIGVDMCADSHLVTIV